tara:strand:- start:1390 stop:2790 length:1401 start_codon:yes stop_codon:yes gene_type:complete
MKTFILNFITKKKINLNDDSFKKFINLINIPLDYLNIILEKTINGYNIFGSIKYNTLHNDIINNKLLNRKSFIKIIKNSISQMTYLPFSKFNNTVDISYTKDNYLLLNDKSVNLDNHSIISNTEINYKNVKINGGLLFVNHKNIVNDHIGDNITIMDNENIKQLQKKIISYGKKKYGANYSIRDLITIFINEKQSIKNYKTILIYYTDYINLLEHEKLVLNCIVYDYIWFIFDNKIDNIYDIDKDIYRLLNKNKNRKNINNKNYIYQIFKKCSYKLECNRQYSIKKIYNKEWEKKLLDYIYKYTGHKYNNIIELYELFDNKIVFKEYSDLNSDSNLNINSGFTCEICYNNKKHGYIECINNHIFCEECYITSHILKKKCSICQINGNIKWHVNKNDKQYYKYGCLSNIIGKIYIHDAKLYNYYLSIGLDVINNIDDIMDNTLIYCNNKNDILYNIKKNNITFLEIN